MPTYSPDPIQSVTNAVEQFAKLKTLPSETQVFRGHAVHDWPMKAYITRSSENIQKREYELVRELIAVAPGEFADDQTMFDRLVRMQHFGLPTRLLDTTSNPLVALYFATRETEKGDDGAVVVAKFERDSQKYFDSDTVSCISNLANLTHAERKSIEDSTAKTIASFNRLKAVDRLVQFVREEKPAFRPKIHRMDLFKRIHVVPKMSNPRIVAQSGSFILFGLTRPPGMPVSIRLRRIRVPAKHKADIRHELALLGITESSLFPELDRAASHIVGRLSKLP